LEGEVGKKGGREGGKEGGENGRIKSDGRIDVGDSDMDGSSGVSLGMLSLS